MYTIYKATNKINGKAYIGFDCNWPYRKSAHKCAASKGKSQVFYNAIRKHGWDNFQWEVLEQSENKDLLLHEKEKFYIKKYNTHYLDGEGYNMTYGGEATFGWKMPDETKQKISESKKGKTPWNKGIPSPWTSERNRNAVGIKKPWQCKTYKIIDPMGSIHIVTGLKEFCKLHNLHVGNMSSVAYGKLKHYKKWQCILISDNK